MSESIAMREGLEAIPAYVPGRRPSAEAADRVHVRLASNESAVTPPTAVARAIAEAAAQANRYPEFSSDTLKDRIAEWLGVGADQVAVGNGSSGLIRDLTGAYCGPGDEVVFAEPSFPYYRTATVAAGAVPVGVPLVDHRHDLDALAAAITKRTRIVFVCNPNNPTGTVVPLDDIVRFADAVPAGVLVVVDEAYIEYAGVDSALDMARSRPHVVVLRTLSKAYGLAGIRVGFAIGDAGIIGGMARVAVPFGVSSIAQAAALAALSPEVLEETAGRIAEVVQRRAELETALVTAQWPVVPSSTNFVFLPMDDAGTLARELEAAGVYVRGMRHGLRITVGTADEQRALLDALDAHRNASA